MQSGAACLRHYKKPLSNLFEFGRNSVSVPTSACVAKLNPSCSDQQKCSFQTSCNSTASDPVRAAVSVPPHLLQTVFAQTFASTAEFTGGSFTVSSSTSEGEDSNAGHQEIDDKDLLLESALQFVADKGWSDAALISGAQHIGLSPAAIGLLPRGPAELVEYFENKCNMELASRLQSNKAEWQHMRTTQRVKEGLKMRLEMNAPYIDTWAQALSIRAQPRNIPTAVEQLAQITDDIWHAAGDKSTDYNWYTKRGLLAGVYTATELYMLTDYSPGFAETWDVLDRRLKDVMTMGRVMGQMGSSAASLMEQMSSTFSQLIPRNQA